MPLREGGGGLDAKWYGKPTGTRVIYNFHKVNSLKIPTLLIKIPYLHVSQCIKMMVTQNFSRPYLDTLYGLDMITRRI